MPLHTRSLASFLSVAALTASLTACGGGDEDASTPAADASSPTLSAGTPATQPEDESSSAETTGTVPADPAVKAFLARTRKALGNEGSAHVKMTLGGPVDSVAEGDSAYGPDGNEMRLKMSLPEMDGAKLEMLVVDGSSYMAMPGVTPPGKYFELPTEGPLAGAVSGGLSPADSFAGIEAGLEKVEKLGSEEIGGTPTDRFRLHVDTERSMSAMKVNQLPAELPETLVYDVWLDAQDRMRRVRYEVAGTKLTMDLTDWGKEFSVTVPDAKDLVEPPPGM